LSSAMAASVCLPVSMADYIPSPSSFGEVQHATPMKLWPDTPTWSPTPSANRLWHGVNFGTLPAAPPKSEQSSQPVHMPQAIGQHGVAASGHDSMESGVRTVQLPQLLTSHRQSAHVPKSPSKQALHDDVLSQGSRLHVTGQCRPCAWYYKPQGCKNRQDCSYCHLCPEGELKQRKKEKITAMRMGALTPACSLPLEHGSGRKLKLNPLLQETCR
jgi:hypothetical protein